MKKIDDSACMRAEFDVASLSMVDCHGDNWHMTALSDGSHLVAMCDELGYEGMANNRYFNSRMLKLIESA